MKIWLDHISKRYQRNWLFKEINYTFITPGSYALLGANGSGKSTLLRIIAGMQNPTKGKVVYEPTLDPVKAIGFTAPGQEIVEELTFREFLDFHFSFKRILAGLNTNQIIDLTGLTPFADKPIADYSSGMKQRVKLVQAIFSNTSILLLDEPCSNLDQQGVDQYHAWMREFTRDRMVIIASNDIREYEFCKERIELSNYK